MNNTIYMKVGDRLPTLQATLTNSDGTAIDLTGATVAFKLKHIESATVLGGAASISDALAGIVTYAWAAADTATAGDYEAEFVITVAGKDRTVPSDSYIEVRITEEV